MSEKMKANLCICVSDTHWGHEDCLYETYWHTVDKLCNELEYLSATYDLQNVYLATVGDLVSGTQVFRNQYLQSHLQKNEDIISFASFILHKTLLKLEKAVKMPVKTFIVVGTHEGLMRAFAHNFAIGVARRLASYDDHIVRYASKYYILDLAKGIHENDYYVLFYHGYGHADYSSASPSLVREMTTVHSQLSAQKGIIIQRFCIGHSHWLEVGRSVLGIRFDCLGGFQRWEKKISNREAGVIYYLYKDDGDFDARGISGLKMQIEESDQQGLHSLNMIHVAEILQEAYKFEIDQGILRAKDLEEL